MNTVSPTAAKTFWYNAADDLDDPVFSANLVHNAAGSYDIGFIDDTAFDGDLTYTAVSKLPGYWKFTSTGYGVGDDDFVDESIVGIADTGTTLIYLPAAIVKAYYAQVDGATSSLLLGGYIFDCDADLPDFQFGVEDTVITVPGSYMNYVRISLLFSPSSLICNKTLTYDHRRLPLAASASVAFSLRLILASTSSVTLPSRLPTLSSTSTHPLWDGPRRSKYRLDKVDNMVDVMVDEGW